MIKLKRSWLPIVLTTFLIGVSGCNDDQNAVNEHSDGNVSVNNVNSNPISVNNVTNQNLMVSTRASEIVERMEEIDLAQVIIRNNDAFVAVRLNNHQNTTNNNSNESTIPINNISDKNRNRNNTDTPLITRIAQNNDNAGSEGHAGSPRITGVGTNTDNAGSEGNAGMRTNNGTDYIGAYTGTNLRVNNNGTGGPNNEGASRLQQSIANQVRSVNRNIDNVYVSFDPNIYNHMTSYARYLQNGRNRDQVLTDFSDTIERFFNQ